MISLGSFLRLSFVVLSVTFSASSPVVIWIAEQFRHLHESDVLVSFRERLVLCRFLLGRFLSACYH